MYAAGNPRQRKLVWVDRSDQVTPIGDDHGAYFDATLSPDGLRIGYVDRWEIWMHDVARGTRSRLIVQPDGPLRGPAWSADGSQVFFSSERTRDWDVYVAPVTSPASWRALVSKPLNQTPSSAAPDGTLAFTDVNPGTGSDIAIVTPEGVHRAFRATRATEGDPRFSNDGRWLAFTSNESGRGEVYVQAFPQAGEPVKISTDGGSRPMWRGDGRPPAKLFPVPPAASAIFDVTPDGMRFLAIQAEPGSEPARLEIPGILARLSCVHVDTNDAVLPGRTLFRRSTEALESFPNGHLLETSRGQDVDELCTRQSASDSTCPEIDILT